MEAQSVAYGPLAVHAQSMMEQRMAEGGLADAMERQGISSASCNRSGCLSLWVPLQSPQDKLPCVFYVMFANALFITHQSSAVVKCSQFKSSHYT